MGPLQSHAACDPVPFGNLVLYSHAQIRKGRPQGGSGGRETIPAARHTGQSRMVDEVGGDELVG